MSYRINQKNAKRGKDEGEGEVHNETEEETVGGGSGIGDVFLWWIDDVGDHILLRPKDVGDAVCDLVTWRDCYVGCDAHKSCVRDEIRKCSTLKRGVLS